MLKKNRKTTIITSIVILLPMICGLVLWNRLPAELAIHFGADGKPDSWGSKFFVVAVFPCILLLLHWIAAAGTDMDPKKKNISEKLGGLILWLVPAVSVFALGSIYLYELNGGFQVDKAVTVLLSFLLIVVGYYLPKTKQSYTVGIKLPWTLADEDNWDRTHKMAGKVWMVCGALAFIASFLQLQTVILPLFLAAVLVPSIYSFLLYKRNRKDAS